MKTLPASYLEPALHYDAYNQLIETLLQNQQTTGTDHSPDMIHYTRMNVVRMERLMKTTRLLPEVRSILQQVERPLIWLTLTEAWCGDAAQINPVLQKMADQNDRIQLRFLLRDEHPELMNAFLTNGSRSIPKLIVIEEENLQILGSWGPRPHMAQEIAMRGRERIKALPSEKQADAYNELLTTLQKWYARDKTTSIQEEVGALIQNITASWQKA